MPGRGGPVAEAHKHDRVAVLHETAAGRLLGENAGFEAEGGVADLSFDANFFQFLAS